MATLYSPRIVTNGLALILDAGNTKSYAGSGTTWVDLSGNAFNGTLRNGPIVFNSGSIRNLSFDGLNDYVELTSTSNRWVWTHSDIGNPQYSFEMWVNSSDTSGWYLSKPWNGSGQYNYTITHNSWTTLAGNQSHSQTFTSLATNTWEHIVCVIDNTQKTVYRNGIVNAASVNHLITGSIPSAGNQNLPLAVMTLYPYGDGWGGVTGHAISGSLGLVRAYTKVLTADEVLQNYNATRSRFGV